MKKLGCAKCGGTKKMKLGGSAIKKAPVEMYGIPQENMGTSGQMGFGRKGGTLKKEHPITTFRKANEARDIVVKSSMKKMQDGGASFGMLSVKAGVDKNPKPTVADRIAGAKMNNKKMAKGGTTHPGFKAVQSKIAAKQGISKEAAGAILASSARKASAKAKATNPRLKRVKG